MNHYFRRTHVFATALVVLFSREVFAVPPEGLHSLKTSRTETAAAKPTPLPSCTPTPTCTPTATETPTATGTPTPTLTTDLSKIVQDSKYISIKSLSTDSLVLGETMELRLEILADALHVDDFGKVRLERAYPFEGREEDLGLSENDLTKVTPLAAVFAKTIYFADKVTGVIWLRATAIVDGKVHVSPLKKLQIKVPESEAGDPDEIIREAARLLELGDRAGLTKLYVKAPRIPRTLDALDDLALKRIAAAYRTARLVRSLEHLRVYEFDFVLPNGESRRTEVMVGRLVTGEWRLRNL